MSSDVLPNNVLSNLCVLIIIPLVSSFVIRTKHRLCDTYSRRPRQLTVDQQFLVTNNLLSFCSIVVWSAAAPDNSLDLVEQIVVVDLLVGMHVQRWLEKQVFAADTAPYYEPGPLSLAQRKRRAKISLVITTLSCAFCAAVSFVVIQNNKGLRTMQLHNYSSQYWFIVAGLPAIHSGMRTIVLDTQGCKKRSTMDVEQSLEIPTNEFTITDEEDEDLDQDEDVVAI